MSAEAQRLEALADRLRAVDPVTPSPAAKIRAWNLVAASIERSTPVHSPRGSAWRFALAAGAAAVLLAAGGVAASANSLPDSPFYPLKTAIEQARGVLALSATDRLSYHLELAQTRLTEAEAMIAGHRIDLAEAALASMNDQLQDAAGVVSGEQQSLPATSSDMENRLEQAISVHDRQLAGLQGEVSNPVALQAIAQARARAAQTLQSVAKGSANGSQGNGSGQTQGGKGSANPHPTPKK